MGGGVQGPRPEKYETAVGPEGMRLPLLDPAKMRWYQKIQDVVCRALGFRVGVKIGKNLCSVRKSDLEGLMLRHGVSAEKMFSGISSKAISLYIQEIVSALAQAKGQKEVLKSFGGIQAKIFLTRKGMYFASMVAMNTRGQNENLSFNDKLDFIHGVLDPRCFLNGVYEKEFGYFEQAEGFGPHAAYNLLLDMSDKEYERIKKILARKGWPNECFQQIESLRQFFQHPKNAEDIVTFLREEIFGTDNPRLPKEVTENSSLSDRFRYIFNNRNVLGGFLRERGRILQGEQKIEVFGKGPEMPKIKNLIKNMSHQEFEALKIMIKEHPWEQMEGTLDIESSSEELDKLRAELKQEKTSSVPPVPGKG